MQRPVVATHRRALALAGAAALLAGAGLAAWLLASQPPVAANTHASLPAGAAGLRVAIQPETGDFELPSPEQMQALGGAGSTKPRGDLVLRTRADGGLTVDVRGHFLSYAVVRRNADGTLELIDVTDPRAVEPGGTGATGGSPAKPAAPPAPVQGEVQ